MRRYVNYHNDGSVRMDWYTFCKMPVEKIVNTIKENTTVRQPHTIRPTSRTAGVKEFI